jgi:hypothetical protein
MFLVEEADCSRTFCLSSLGVPHEAKPLSAAPLTATFVPSTFTHSPLFLTRFFRRHFSGVRNAENLKKMIVTAQRLRFPRVRRNSKKIEGKGQKKNTSALVCSL